MLCKRQFASEKKLGQHLVASELHKTNWVAAQASGRVHAPSSIVPEGGAAESRKRPLETSSRFDGSQRLKQMEEFEKALAAKSASSSMSDSGGSGYRDRAKERREQVGGYSGLQARGLGANSTVRSARDINGNLDWRCGHCSKLNFAREISCISCMRDVRACPAAPRALPPSSPKRRLSATRQVDELTEYLDSTDFQKQRHRGMLKLAQRLEPGMSGGDRVSEGQNQRPLS